VEDLYWDPEELSCREPAMAGWLVALIVIALLTVSCCGCCVFVHFCRKIL
jgi:hypothetical protein